MLHLCPCGFDLLFSFRDSDQPVEKSAESTAEAEEATPAEEEADNLAAEATDEAPARIVADLVVDVTPGRKSFRTPKPARKSSGPKPRKEVAAVRKSSRFLSKEKARARRSSIGFATVGVKASVKSNKKQGPPVVDVTPGRKSSRTPKPARKGCNTRLERGDEVVDIPQVKVKQITPHGSV